MDLALHVANLSWPGSPEAVAGTLTEIARTADQAGVRTLTMMDHWFQMENLGGPAEPMLEGYTALGFLAGQTSSIELGLLVTGVTYRHPGLLAKIVATLDVLSGGRAMLGLGAAWYEREHLGLGVPFPVLKERFERLEEALQVTAQMFGPEEGPYTGRHYQLAETVCRPAPLHRPRVLIGGGGERKTLRLVAQYADACNLFPLDLEALRHKLAVLDQHCADVGRDPGEVARTVITTAEQVDDTDAFLRTAEQWSGLGISQVYVVPPAIDATRWVNDLCARVLPRLASV